MRRAFPRWCCTLGAILVLVPSQAGAQETAAGTIESGRRAISFDPFGDGGMTVGLWRVRSETAKLGLLVNAAIDHDRVAIEGDDNDRTSTLIGIGIGPELRRYHALSGRVAPFGFLGGRVAANYRRISDEAAEEPDEAWSFELDGDIGLGAEFFPVRNVGLDARVGIGLDLDYEPRSDPDIDVVGIRLGTFTASLGASFYF